MTAPLFEGTVPVVATVDADGQLCVSGEPPGDVVIPPGYTMNWEIQLGADEHRAHYRVVPTPGLHGWWLRWRYPYQQP